MIEIKWTRVHDYGCEPWRAMEGDANGFGSTGR